jgi:DNA-binding XRE family transcriptional regulator
MKLSDKLKKWRGVEGKGKGSRGEFSQAEAARRLSTNFKTYIDWEQGRFAPRGIALVAVLERIK